MSRNAAAAEQPVTDGTVRRWYAIAASVVGAIAVAAFAWASLLSRVQAVEAQASELRRDRDADAAWRGRVDRQLSLIVCKLDPQHCDPRNP